MAVVDADIYTVCQAIDTMIEEATKATFNSRKSKKMERGIAFPTCISVNHVMGHYSPMSDESTKLADGDVAKIICGAHFDGYAANAAVTVVVGSKVTGKAANAIHAAHNAMQAAQRVIRDGATNNEVTEAIAKVCAEYEVNAVEGVLSHKVKKHLIDGNECIINKETGTQQVEDYTFAPGDVFGLDIYVSTGEGKPKEGEQRTTVFKRELQTVYNLKSKSARSFFVEVNKRFPTLPFAIRACEDATAAKVGVRECMNHDMLVPYPVLVEKPEEFVAQFKSTIAVLPRSTAVLAGDVKTDLSKAQSDKAIKDEALKKLIGQELWKKEDKKAAAKKK